MNYPQAGQRYMFEGSDDEGHDCKILYEIVSSNLDENQDCCLCIKRLQVFHTKANYNYNLYETNYLHDLNNKKCSFTYLQGQDHP